MSNEFLDPAGDPLGSEQQPPEIEGGHAGRLARAAVIQQVAQVARLAAGLIVVTVLVRKLPLSEFGTYTILISLVTYVMFLKQSVMNAAIVGVASAGRDEDGVSTVVSTGLAVYTVLGVLSSALLTGVGLAVLPLLNVPHDIYGSAQAGVVALGVATFLSWPVQIFDDLLRGLQRFAAVSVLEIGALVVYVAGAVALAFASAPVWALVGWNASIPMLMGLACLVALRRLGVRIGVSRAAITRTEARRFGSVSGLLVVGGMADLATYSVDRAILSGFRSPATVGLYEGPLGAQNMVRYFTGVLTATVLPATTDFLAAGDQDRVRELYLRGLRYSLAATVPLVLVMTITPGPILQAWLGTKFGAVAGATSLFCGWWLLGANNSVGITMLFSAGKVKNLTAVSVVVAIVNLSLALALTPSLGLYGPIVASVTALSVSLLYQFPQAVRTVGVSYRDVAREAWLPAYSTAAAVALPLGAIALFVGIDTPLAAVAALVGTPLLYWALYAWRWLDSFERRLVRNLIRLRPR